MWHSGTLAAAKQAALLGLRGIALSAPVDDETTDFSSLEPWVERVLELLLRGRAARSSTSTSRASRRACAGRAQAVRAATTARSSRARIRWAGELYWFTVAPIEEPAEGTDLWAVQNGYVSLTPLRLDLTDHDELRRATGSLAWT